LSYADEHPDYKIENTEQATRWIESQIELTESRRREVDEQLTAAGQRTAWTRWMLQHGSALGVVMALHRVGLIGDVAYNLFNERIKRTTVPTVDGKRW
jgi:hypothetical protein